MTTKTQWRLSWRTYAIDRLTAQRHFLMISLSLVGGLEVDREKMTMAAAAVAPAHALGLGVIAEGVETSWQLAHLRGLGCDLVQGP